MEYAQNTPKGTIFRMSINSAMSFEKLFSVLLLISNQELADFDVGQGVPDKAHCKLSPSQ
jgi:hypothetical protein